MAVYTSRSGFLRSFAALVYNKRKAGTGIGLYYGKTKTDIQQAQPNIKTSGEWAGTLCKRDGDNMRDKTTVTAPIPRDAFYPCGSCQYEKYCDEPCAELSLTEPQENTMKLHLQIRRNQNELNI